MFNASEQTLWEGSAYDSKQYNVIPISPIIEADLDSEAEFKEKLGVWDSLPELTITSTYVDSRIDSNTCTTGNPMSEPTLTLCHRRLYPPVRDLGFALSFFSAIRIEIQDRIQI